MKKTITVILLLSLLLSGCSETEESSWQAGQKALAEENYTAAVEAFEKAGGYQDSERLLQYAEAWLAIENEDYAEAAAGFRALGDYKDCLLMEVYCSAREKETAVRTAISAGKMDQAAAAGGEAVALYATLPYFRDSSMRGEDLRSTLFTYASEQMSQGEYALAAAVFGALGNWQESSSLQIYCQAAELEKQGSWVEAAALYDELLSFQDAADRAEAAREQAYRQAAELKEQGEYEASSAAFAALGSYRDAEQQRDNVLALGIHNLLQDGAYAQVLERFVKLADQGLFQETDSAASGIPEYYLAGFVQSWMNAHAGVLNGFFSRNLLQPYLQPGGELDSLLQTEIPDDAVPQNYGFVFYSAQVQAMYELDEGFTAARLHGSSSCFESGAWAESEETLWVLVDSNGGMYIAAAASAPETD